MIIFAPFEPTSFDRSISLDVRIVFLYNSNINPYEYYSNGKVLSWPKLGTFTRVTNDCEKKYIYDFWTFRARGWWFEDRDQENSTSLFKSLGHMSWHFYEWCIVLITIIDVVMGSLNMKRKNGHLWFWWNNILTMYLLSWAVLMEYTVLNMYEYTWVHMRGIDLDFAILRIHMVYML